MKKYLLSYLIILTGCVHKPDIEQGNIVTQAQLHKLHRGMSISEVKALLGGPILDVPFNNNKLEYVYTMQKGKQIGHGKNLSLSFKNDKLTNISPRLFSLPAY